MNKLAILTYMKPPMLQDVERVAVITLRPSAPTKADTRKKVVWTEDTVDNENMNKKKSKCEFTFKKAHMLRRSHRIFNLCLK